MQNKVEAHLNRFFELINGVECTLGNEKIHLHDWYEAVFSVLSKKKRDRQNLYIIGNGASCSMASHFATDFTKNGGVQTHSINDGSLLTAFANDYSFQTSYAEMLKLYARPGDGLIAISSSGRSMNILNAVEVMNHLEGSVTITLSGFSVDNPLRRKGDFNLFIASGEYGPVESAHSYFIHMMLDIFIELEKEKNDEKI